MLGLEAISLEIGFLCSVFLKLRRIFKVPDMSLWLGGTDILQVYEFLWATSGTRITYDAFRDWQPRQPDNAGDSKHCLMMNSLYGSFSDSAQIPELSLWLGGTDVIQERNFLWATSGTRITYDAFNDWHPQQPDNAGDSEHCLMIDQHSGWHVAACSELKRYVCEKDNK